MGSRKEIFREYSLFAIIGLLYVVLLHLLDNVLSNDVEGIEDTKELIYLEKTKEYNRPSLIFESKEDRAYYLIEVDNYEYDNLEQEKEDVMTVDVRKAKGYNDPINKIYLNTYLRGYGVFTGTEFLYGGDWKPVAKLTEYTKE